MNDFVARIRWGNLARIGAVLGAIGLIAAWPKLKSSPPALPPAVTVPDARPPAPLVATPPATTEPKASTVPADSRGDLEPQPTPKSKPKPRRKRRKPRPEPAPAAQPAPPAQPAPAPVAPRKPQPSPEFEAFG